MSADQKPTQMGFNLGEPTGVAALENWLKGGWFPWKSKMNAYLRYVVQPGEIGSGESWRKAAAKYIGEPPNREVIGAAFREAAERGLIEKTGRPLAPQDPKSHGSMKAEWRRTNVK